MGTREVIVAVVCLALCPVARADLLPLAANGSVGSDYASTEWYYGSVSNDGNVLDNRIAIEFGTMGIKRPGRAILTLWQLDADPAAPPQVALYAYQGNGSISTADYRETSRLVGYLAYPPGYHYGSTIPGDTGGVPFDTDVSEAVLLAYENGWDYLGFLLRSTRPTPGYTGNLTISLSGTRIVHGQPDYVGGFPPSLAYEPIPEPATLLLLALGGLAMLRRRG